MRGRIWLAGAAVLLARAAGRGAGPVAVPAGEPVAVDVAAASSGGACRLLDFAVIEEHTEVRFDVAAASERATRHTCVVRATEHHLPELTLTVTDTSIDVATFTADVLPDGATKVSKLGQAAYRRTGAKTAKHGPTAEVGWLAAEDRLATLRWTCPPADDRATAGAVAARLVDLARKLDTRAPVTPVRADGDPEPDQPGPAATGPTPARRTPAAARVSGRRRRPGRRPRGAAGSGRRSGRSKTPSRSWATVTVAPGSTPAACSWRSTSASVCTLSQMRPHHDRAGQPGEGQVALALDRVGWPRPPVRPAPPGPGSGCRTASGWGG